MLNGNPERAAFVHMHDTLNRQSQGRLIALSGCFLVQYTPDISSHGQAQGFWRRPSGLSKGVL